MNIRTDASLVPTESWDPALNCIIDDMRGKPLNVHKLLARHPRLLKAWWPLRQYCVTGGLIGQSNAELVILRTAIHMGSWYEWGSHVVRALDCGLSVEQVRRVAEGPTADGWTSAEAALLIAVDELNERRSLTQNVLDSLEIHFSNEQIFDLIAIHSMYFMLGALLNTWSVKLDAHVAAKLPTTETESHFCKRLKVD